MKKKRTSNFLGTYQLPGEQSVVGELRLNGASTSLKLHSDEFLARIEEATYIEGVTYSGECVTLIDCLTHGVAQRTSRDGATSYSAEVFPHYVAVGRRHLKVGERCVKAIHFTATDLETLFYDFDAFSTVIDSKSIIDVVLRERRQIRSVETGETPRVLYFTGKDCIANVSTAIGRVAVHHRPRHSWGGPSGVFLKNRIVVTVAPDQPVSFIDAVDRMHDVATFLSMAAGRTQGLKHIHISTTESTDSIPIFLNIYPSYRWKRSDKGEQHKPHPGNVPLDPIRNKSEFDAVLSDWIGRQNDWRTARFRYLECMRKGNKYGPERLVAAANIFDILPTDALPSAFDLPDELATTRDECSARFRMHPTGVDRNSALSALGRLGKPSLPKKVAHRVAIIDSKLGELFPELQFVTSIAVRCRNFFVHGSSTDFDYQKIEPFVPFLTDALEFVFVASDLIDAGWNAQRRKASLHGRGHSFARFRAVYDMQLAELRRVTNG